MVKTFTSRYLEINVGSSWKIFGLGVSISPRNFDVSLAFFWISVDF